MQQPPWRVMAEEALKANDPQRYKALRRAGKLDAFLDRLAERLRMSFVRTVEDLEESRPNRSPSFLMQSAQEILVHEVLLPETSAS